MHVDGAKNYFVRKTISEPQFTSGVADFADLIYVCPHRVGTMFPAPFHTPCKVVLFDGPPPMPVPGRRHTALILVFARQFQTVANDGGGWISRLPHPTHPTNPNPTPPCKAQDTDTRNSLSSSRPPC